MTAWSKEQLALLPVAEYERKLSAQVKKLPSTTITADQFGNSLGLVLAEDVFARLPVPPFANSAMDGFAVNTSSIRASGVTLPVCGDVPAGTVPPPLPAGAAMRIMTGAPVPTGCNAVIKVEDTDHQPQLTGLPQQVQLFVKPVPGANIRRQGEDVAAGDRILAAGQVLGPAQLAAAASAGIGQLQVIRRPKVAVISTGDELADPEQVTAASGLIPDSNLVLLSGLVQQAGAQVVQRLRLPDQPAAFAAALRDIAAEVDVIFTAGGISQGAYEVVRQVLAGQDQEVPSTFCRVAQQPGGPQGFALFHGTLVVSFPGNPVSVYVSFHRYGAGLLHVLAGRAKTISPVLREVVAGVDFTSPAAKTQFVPVRLEQGEALPVHQLRSGSHLAVALAQCSGLAVIPAGETKVMAGQSVAFLPTERNDYDC